MKRAIGVLQVEVTTEEEWQELLTHPGLVVVDVYSDWSGPCSAMASTLRKIKFEVGHVDYAIARNDDIADLERYRGRSEPVWMFLQDGKMVNLMFGAHCPQLQKLLISEINRVQEEVAPTWELHVYERAPEEQERWEEEEKIR
jgi:thioredoxin-like negative regulator of GroEL